MTTETSPAQGFALFGDGAGADPYPMYALLRANAPVAPIGDAGLWAVAKYDDVVRILRDHETFSSIVGARQLTGEAEFPSMIFNDPPMHTRLRGMISRAFTPRVVELQREYVQANCDELLGKLLATDEGDVVAGLAYPLPVMVIANMLGVQDGDMATFKRWSDHIIENLGPALIQGDDSGMSEINQEFDAYFSAQLDALRRNPTGTLLSDLVHVETEEGRLTQEELLMFCRLLLVAGNETTTGLIVNAFRVFSEFPDVLTRLRQEPSLLPLAIEETLRYYAPFQGTFRRTTREVEVSGVTIPPSQRIIVLLASANRDESAFERANEFVIDREPNRHVGFGLGIHYCVGAPLARLEGEIAMRGIVDRVERLEIVGTDDSSLLRPGGPKAMHVRFTRCGVGAA